MSLSIRHSAASRASAPAIVRTSLRLTPHASHQRRACTVAPRSESSDCADDTARQPRDRAVRCVQPIAIATRATNSAPATAAQTSNHRDPARRSRRHPTPAREWSAARRRTAFRLRSPTCRRPTRRARRHRARPSAGSGWISIAERRPGEHAAVGEHLHRVALAALGDDRPPCAAPSARPNRDSAVDDAKYAMSKHAQFQPAATAIVPITVAATAPPAVRATCRSRKGRDDCDTRRDDPTRDKRATITLSRLVGATRGRLASLFCPLFDRPRAHACHC